MLNMKDSCSHFFQETHYCRQMCAYNLLEISSLRQNCVSVPSHRLDLSLITGRGLCLFVKGFLIMLRTHFLITGYPYEPSGRFSEVKRVLKPGGAFLFVEHVAAPGEFLPWQVAAFSCVSF